MKETQHTFKPFDADIAEIRAKVSRMGGFAAEQLRDTLKAFVEGERKLMDSVIERDKTVDAMEIDIDEACTRIIARHQPAAVDLRMIMAIGKAVTDLERIGDEAKKIAKAARKIMDRGAPGCVSQIMQIRHMGDLAVGMLEEALDAFMRHDVDSAGGIVRSDKEIDEHFRAILRQLITFMMEDPRTIGTALDVVFIAKSVERIGDHAKNIAEDVIYIARGRDVRHIGLEGLERELKAAE